MQRAAASRGILADSYRRIARKCGGADTRARLAPTATSCWRALGAVTRAGAPTTWQGAELESCPSLSLSQSQFESESESLPARGRGCHSARKPDASPRQMARLVWRLCVSSMACGDPLQACDDSLERLNAKGNRPYEAERA